MYKKYNLIDKIEGDVLSSNIYLRRRKLYNNIMNFSIQGRNDGVFAENILRLIFDGVNLNHLYKNHPHVDIAIVNEIPDITKKDEVISVKSSTKFNPSLASIISDTKAIKLESMFSYVMYALNNFELGYKTKYFRYRELFNECIDAANLGNKKFKEVINICLYYLIVKNDEIHKLSFDSDINTITNTDNTNLSYGNYQSYRIAVLRNLSKLDTPVSLGLLYLENRDEDLICVIKKTNDISLKKYWELLLDIWSQSNYFTKTSSQYLKLAQVKKLFNIGDDFPIKIEISTKLFNDKDEAYDSLSDSEKMEIVRKRAGTKTNKLYVATKFKDADFGRYEDDINDFFIKLIKKLEWKPQLIKNFQDFNKDLS
jgi:hypothetical protein